jgi:hypothetical protein
MKGKRVSKEYGARGRACWAAYPRTGIIFT